MKAESKAMRTEDAGNEKSHDRRMQKLERRLQNHDVRLKYDKLSY
jgi:hypothetical protein